MDSGILNRLCRGCGVASGRRFRVQECDFWKTPLTLSCLLSARFSAALREQQGRLPVAKSAEQPRPARCESHLVTQFLREHPCIGCGESDPVVLEFNHFDPATKTANICDMIHFRVSPARIQLEIGKCE